MIYIYQLSHLKKQIRQKNFSPIKDIIDLKTCKTLPASSSDYLTIEVTTKVTTNKAPKPEQRDDLFVINKFAGPQNIPKMSRINQEYDIRTNSVDISRKK